MAVFFFSSFLLLTFPLVYTIIFSSTSCLICELQYSHVVERILSTSSWSSSSSSSSLKSCVYVVFLFFFFSLVHARDYIKYKLKKHNETSKTPNGYILELEIAISVVVIESYAVRSVVCMIVMIA